MSKRILGAIAIAFVATAVWADEDSEFFKLASPAVVYVEQSVKMLPEYFPNTELLQILEKKINRKILGEYLALASGSGFFIDARGHIVTNAHVVDRSDEQRMRDDNGQGWSSYIDSTFKDDEMTPDQKKTLKIGLFKAIQKGTIELRVFVENTKPHPASVLAQDKEQDLALLGIDADSENSLPLAEDESIAVGDDVFSIGYPFGSSTVKQLKNLSATFTKGAVSALRDDTLGIQHTATINPGNSGGPLLDKNGRVVGVNSAMRTNANNTYFAISVALLRTFLDKKNFSDLSLTETVAKPGTPALKTLAKNSLDEYEVSSDLIFKQEKGAKVFVDGTLVGTTPLFYNPPQSSFSVRVEGATGYAEGTFRVLKSKQGSTDVLIPWVNYKGTIVFDRSDSRTKYWLDGKAVEAKQAQREVLAGSHTLVARKPGTYFEPVELFVGKNETVRPKLVAEEAHPVRFVASGERPTIVATRNGKSVTFSSDDAFELPDGEWNLTIKANDFFEDGGSSIVVDGAPQTFDASTFELTGFVLIKNWSPDSIVYVDLIRQDRIENGKFSARVGKHELEVLQKGFQPYKTTVTVTKNATKSVTVEAAPSLSGIGSSLIWTGALTTLTGVGIATITWYNTEANYVKYGHPVAPTTNQTIANGWTTAGIGALVTLLGVYLDSTRDSDLARKE